MSLARLYAQGGWAMFPLTLLLLLGLAAALGAAVAVLARAKAALAVLFGGMALAVAVLSLSTGVLAQQHALHRLEDAVASVNPLYQPLLREQGEREARIPLTLGVVAAVLPLLAGAAALSAGWRRRGAYGR